MLHAQSLEEAFVFVIEGAHNGGADRATPGKKAVIVIAMGTYSDTGCLPPKCRVDAIMSDSDEYRRRAGECLLFTQYVTSERSKQLLVQMALGWRDLAERAEQQKRGSDEAARVDPTAAGTEKT
jgi:hypothetical protein